MAIQLSKDQKCLADPRIEKVLNVIVTYQETLREELNGLNDQAKSEIARIPNPHLATGPVALFVCSNGIVAMVENGLDPTVRSAKVVEQLNSTMVEFFNSQAEKFFTFRDPISKLSSKGTVAVFQEASVYDGMLVTVVISDRNDRQWVPPASKVFMIGWRYFEHGDPKLKAQDAARDSVKHAHALVNLQTRSAARTLLEQFRRLLNSASHEAELQTFLQSHPEFIYPEHDISVPKPSLGGERQPDFGFSIRSAFGARWIFVEIERPNKQIFTKRDDFQFSSDFTQAKGQLLQWDALITKDLPYFERRFAGLLKPEFHLIFGRDSELDPPRREMLAAEFSTSSNRSFSTFDDLANRFEAIINRVFPSGIE